MEAVQHQGLAPFNPNKGYVVFRNVKDFGAKGDGGLSSSFHAVVMGVYTHANYMLDAFQ